MIDYIRGTLAEKEITRVTIEAHGVGYNVSIPLSTYEKLPDPGAEVKLHIHYQVREDAHKLFGFYTRNERDMFRHLISVNQIGPKVGLSVLSGISIEDLMSCVSLGESGRLEKIPGIGAKTAQRLILELQGKLGKISIGSGGGSSVVPNVSGMMRGGSILDEAFAAMISLGYNDKQVLKALTRLEQIVSRDAPVEEWIKKALQII